MKLSSFKKQTTKWILVLLCLSYSIWTNAQEIIQGTITINEPNPRKNVSLGKLAYQSSTSHGGVASKIVDGNTNGKFTGGSVNSTKNAEGECVEIDLGAIYEIDEIIIYNRTDCCSERASNFEIRISEKVPQNNAYGSIFAAQTDPIPAKQSFKGSATGRFVRFVKTKADYINLAEIEVYGRLVAGQEAPVVPDAATLAAFSNKKPLNFFRKRKADTYIPVLQGGNNTHNTDQKIFDVPLSNRQITEVMANAYKKYEKGSQSDIFTNLSYWNDSEIGPLLEKGLNKLIDARFPALPNDRYQRVHLKDYIKQELYGPNKHSTKNKIIRGEFVIYCLDAFVRALDSNKVPKFAKKLEHYTDFHLSLAAQNVSRYWDYYLAEETLGFIQPSKPQTQYNTLSVLIQPADLHAGKSIEDFENWFEGMNQHPLDFDKKTIERFKNILVPFTTEEMVGLPPGTNRTSADIVKEIMGTVLLGGQIATVPATIFTATVMSTLASNVFKAQTNTLILAAETAAAEAASAAATHGVSSTAYAGASANAAAAQSAAAAASKPIAAKVFAGKLVSIMASKALMGILAGATVLVVGVYAVAGKSIKFSKHGNDLWKKANMYPRSNWLKADKQQRLYNFVFLAKYLIVDPNLDFTTRYYPNASLREQLQEELNVLEELMDNPKTSSKRRALYQQIYNKRASSSLDEIINFAHTVSGGMTNIAVNEKHSYLLSKQQLGMTYLGLYTAPRLITHYNQIKPLPLPRGEDAKDWKIAARGSMLLATHLNGDIYSYKTGKWEKLINLNILSQSLLPFGLGSWNQDTDVNLSIAYDGSIWAVNNNMVFHQKPNEKWRIHSKPGRMHSIWNVSDQNRTVIYGLQKNGDVSRYLPSKKKWITDGTDYKLKKVVGVPALKIGLGLDGKVYYHQNPNPIWKELHSFFKNNELQVTGEVIDIDYQDGLLYLVTKPHTGGTNFAGIRGNNHKVLEVRVVVKH